MRSTEGNMEVVGAGGVAHDWRATFAEWAAGVERCYIRNEVNKQAIL
jgi:hypothetical protein